MPTDAQRRDLASAHHAEVQGLKERIELLEAENEQLRALLNKAKDEFHAARQESALRWQMVCDLTVQRDALAAITRAQEQA